MTNPADSEPQAAPNSENSQVERDRAMINEARAQGTPSLFWAFTKLSGPGWLQSAITLGGGSLAGSLYLGIYGGYGLMWMQPLAMILGVIMLSAIGYVALSTGERPFRAINTHVSPVLGWGWALATLMANFVWCMPQFALGYAALSQNLFPEYLGEMDDQQAKLICAVGLFVVAGIVTWFYDSGGWGIKLFEIILKVMVGLIVICFFGVVIKMTLQGSLNWGEIFAGFIPDLSLLSRPADSFGDVLSRTGDFTDFWSQKIVDEQQSVMIAAVATAVGINMTFLLPYSMLAKGWDRDFRGLAIFDLSTGLIVPFVIATGCVVIASASQFHAKPAAGLVEMYSDSAETEPAENLIKGYNGLLDSRLEKELGEKEFKTLEGDSLDEARGSLPTADRELAAMLVKRDAFNLANSLKEIAGEGMAQKVFGAGVLGMAISTIIVLMLINGFTFCEMIGVPPEGNMRRLGAFMPAFVGFLGPFFWSQASAWLAVPTSNFGAVLLPIAYWTFFFMMNSKSLLGENMPTGIARLRWNVLMLIAAGLATFTSLYRVYYSPFKIPGIIILVVFIIAAFASAASKKKETEN